MGGQFLTMGHFQNWILCGHKYIRKKKFVVFALKQFKVVEIYFNENATEVVLPIDEHLAFCFKSVFFFLKSVFNTVIRIHMKMFMLHYSLP